MPERLSREIIEQLRSAWCAAFDVHHVADARWAVQTPALYDDGDGLPLFIVHESNGWQLTDAGMAVGHLFFDDFEHTEARLRTLRRVVESSGCAIDEDHRITVDLAGPPDVYDIGDFLQVVASVRGAAFAIQVERERTNYVTAMRSRIAKQVFADTVENWAPLADTKGNYRADLRIDRRGHEPVALFIASTSERTKTAAITVEQFKRHDIESQPLLAYRAGTVSDEALNCFLDFAGDDDTIVKLEQGEPITVIRRLERAGVTVAPTMLK